MPGVILFHHPKDPERVWNQHDLWGQGAKSGIRFPITVMAAVHCAK